MSLFFFALIVSSCSLGIEISAANSISAILAVVGEYLLAIVSFVLVFVLHLIRPLSISLILLGILGLTNSVDLPASPYIVLVLGILLLFSFFISLKVYNPKVIIDKNAKKVLEKDTEEDKQNGKHIVIDLGVGIILLVIEYLIFA